MEALDIPQMFSILCFGLECTEFVEKYKHLTGNLRKQEIKSVAFTSFFDSIVPVTEVVLAI